MRILSGRFFQTSLDHSFQVFVLDLKLLERKIVHVDNEFIISVFDLRNQLVQILELMLVNLDHTKSLIVILIQDTFNAGGFSGSGITKSRQLLAFLPSTNAFVLSISFCFGIS